MMLMARQRISCYLPPFQLSCLLVPAAVFLAVNDYTGRMIIIIIIISSHSSSPGDMRTRTDLNPREEGSSNSLTAITSFMNCVQTVVVVGGAAGPGWGTWRWW